jgi:hypothetical protein
MYVSIYLCLVGCLVCCSKTLFLADEGAGAHQWLSRKDLQKEGRREREWDKLDSIITSITTLNLSMIQSCSILFYAIHVSHRKVVKEEFTVTDIVMQSLSDNNVVQCDEMWLIMEEKEIMRMRSMGIDYMTQHCTALHYLVVNVVRDRGPSVGSAGRVSLHCSCQDLRWR